MKPIGITEEKMPYYVEVYLTETERQRKRKDSTQRRYLYDIFSFLEWIKEEKGDSNFDTWMSLRKEDYEAYFNYLQVEKGNSRRTLHRVRTALNQLLKFYRNKGYEVANLETITFRSLVDQLSYEKDDFVSEEEWNVLKQSVISPLGLSERRLLCRPFLINRNLAILTLFMEYGLTMNELAELRMKDVKLPRKTISIVKEEGGREIRLKNEHALLLQFYLGDIPKSVRPRVYSEDPFFVAFDYYRGTYHWDYEQKKPKQLTEVAIQKMIRQEIKKANFNRPITARQLRNTSILNEIKKGKSREEIQHLFGLKTMAHVERYFEFVFREK